MRNLVAKIGAVVAAVIFGLLELVLPFCIDEDIYQKGRLYVWLISFPTLAVFYTITMVYLNSKMRQLNNFEREIRSVRLQFLLLLATFVTHSTYVLAILFKILHETTAAQAIAETYLTCLWEVTPIIYLLHAHHEVFKELAALRLRSPTEET